jgi:hypothetical protein
MSNETNKFFQFFEWQQQQELQQGSGMKQENIFIPELGEIYRYRRGLQTGAGHFNFGFQARQKQGFGFRDYFTNIFQRATPFLRTLGTKVVDIVSDIARDSLKGENVKEAAIKNITKALPEAITGLLTKQGTANPSDTTAPIKRKLQRNTGYKNKKFKKSFSKFPALEHLQ